jgi:hypothetical protein
LGLTGLTKISKISCQQIVVINATEPRCQEPCGSVALPGLSHGENLGSSPPTHTSCKQQKEKVLTVINIYVDGLIGTASDNASTACHVQRKDYRISDLEFSTALKSAITEYYNCNGSRVHDAKIIA